VLSRLWSVNRCWEPAELTCPVGRRLLVLAPHPDDESIGVGGLLLAHRGRCEVHVVNVFMWPSNTNADEAPKIAVRNGYNLLSWGQNGVAYWAVSDLNAEELRSLQRLL